MTVRCRRNSRAVATKVEPRWINKGERTKHTTASAEAVYFRVPSSVSPSLYIYRTRSLSNLEPTHTTERDVCADTPWGSANHSILKDSTPPKWKRENRLKSSDRSYEFSISRHSGASFILLIQSKIHNFIRTINKYGRIFGKSWTILQHHRLNYKL